MITPLDLVKCRIQSGEYVNLLSGTMLLLKEALFQKAGASKKSRVLQFFSVMYVGWEPTLFGYCLQCAIKFGFFEYLKFRLALALPIEAVVRYPLVLLLTASGCAEFIADIVLAPFEVVKVRLQSLPPSRRPARVAEMVPRMWMTEGAQGFFSCIFPLWLRQVPYTMIKFCAFAKFESVLHMVVVGSLKPEKDSSSWLSKFVVVVLAGFGAGAVCAVATQPADVIVSRISQRATIQREGGSKNSFLKVLRDVGGFRGLFRGLLARILLFGTLSSLQWSIYESFRSAVDLQ
jgi:solute carrier family 25 phosphate transporter 3